MGQFVTTRVWKRRSIHFDQTDRDALDKYAVIEQEATALRRDLEAIDVGSAALRSVTSSDLEEYIREVVRDTELR